MKCIIGTIMFFMTNQAPDGFIKLQDPEEEWQYPKKRHVYYKEKLPTLFDVMKDHVIVLGREWDRSAGQYMTKFTLPPMIHIKGANLNGKEVGRLVPYICYTGTKPKGY